MLAILAQKSSLNLPYHLRLTRILLVSRGHLPLGATWYSAPFCTAHAFIAACGSRGMRMKLDMGGSHDQPFHVLHYLGQPLYFKQLYVANLCRICSNKQMVAAWAIFSDSVAPSMGIFTVASAAVMSSGDTPVPSLPKIHADAWCNTKSYKEKLLCSVKAVASTRSV